MAETPTRGDAREALERFRDEFDAKYPKAIAKLDKDWDALTAFYDFPAERSSVFACGCSRFGSASRTLAVF